MQIKYVGNCSDGVVIDATGQYAAPGEAIEVDDTLGASLLEQESNWQAVKAAKNTPKEG